MTSIWIIAQNTFRESVRSKVLYSLMLFALLLVSVSALFGSVTIGDQAKVVKDFGLFSLSLFCTFYVILSGSLLLFKELSRKTIYNILSRAIPRWKFLLGKYVGMLLTASVMLVIMGLGFSLFVLLFDARFDWNLLLAYYSIFLELVIICAAAIFFSSIVVTPMLIGLFTAGVFLAGRSAGFLLYFLDNETLAAPLRYLIKVFHLLLPHLDQLHVADAIVYGVTVPFEQVFFGTVYAFGYAGVLLLLAHLLFERRDFA